MSKSKFFEGLIIGSIIGFIASLILSENEYLYSDKINFKSDKSNNASKEELNTENPNEEKNSQKTEDLVSKTLEAIEQGFTKISKMVNEKKLDQKSKS